MLLSLIKTLITLYGGLSPIEIFPSDYGPNLKNGDEFDFIVVGAGSAGSIVANRISKVSQWRILVLEAGGYPSDMSEIPAVMLSLQGTDEDWQHTISPSKTCCLGLKDSVCNGPRGKALGGSSTINFMMYTRSTKYDHERWANQGNAGWDYESTVKLYKNFENAHIKDNKYYGVDGELHLTRYTSTQPVRKVLSTAYEELGYHKYTEDQPIGFRDLLLSIYQGTRQNVAKAFLAPAKDRKNLYVAVNAQVSRILIDPNTLTAEGVELKIGDRILRLRAKKEVILSAGSYNSPQILMHSGIGPKEHLSEIAIEVLKDLRVGDNYQDHLAFPLFLVQIDHSAVVPLTMFGIVQELYRFFMHRLGELTGMQILNFSSYFNTKNESRFANIQVVHGAAVQNDPYILQEYFRIMRLPEDVEKSITDFNKHSSFLILFPILLNPKSSGHVRLQNTDPFSKPVIIPNYCNDEEGDDIEVMLNAVKQLTKLIATKPFSPYNPKIVDVNLTNCREYVPQSDDYWKCAIRNTATPIYHPVGTCKMGPADDTSAVVDPELKVYGINRLRVIDASIMPEIPSCNTNAPTIMIGEKGAELIKKTWINRHDEL